MKDFDTVAKFSLLIILLTIIIIIIFNNSNIKSNISINYWKDIDTTQVVGEVQDTCRCTIINDKMYRVKIKMVQQEVYQPYK